MMIILMIQNLKLKSIELVNKEKKQNKKEEIRKQLHSLHKNLKEEAENLMSKIWEKVMNFYVFNHGKVNLSLQKASNEHKKIKI
jgi:hypothetical protein